MTKHNAPRARRQKARYQPRFELLEDRSTPAALLTVNSTLDTNVRDTVLTLREALFVNNRTLAVATLTAAEQLQVVGTPTNVDTDTIAFNLGVGTPLINVPATALPTITDPVIMDGATGGATRVHLRGPGFSPLWNVPDGLRVTAGASTFKSLIVSNFLSQTLGGAIHLETAGGNVVTGCWIGTDATGVSADMNRIGVFINNVPDNVIGGTAAGAGNVIASSDFGNIRITGDNATGNVIQGNFIGTNASGTAKIAGPADGGGILIIAADNNLVGGTAPGARNIISGTGGPGISLRAVTFNGVGVTGTRIEGNYIGTDVTGTAKIANALGIEIENSPGNFIGGAAPGAGNVISGNGSSAILINRFASSGNVIQGNLIGTDATGTALLSNGTVSDAISIFEAADTLIGGTVAGAGNVISGSANGIHIAGGGGGTSAVGTIIQGNYIGTDITGMVDLGNTQWGILNSGGVRTQVGGRTALARNVISGNDADGIIWSPHRDSTGDVIEGNYIGVAADGMTALGNGLIPGRIGIFVGSGTGTVIGGTADGAGNVISGNSGDGIRINVNNGNVIQGNLIGVAADGTTALANGGHGVALWGGGNVVGGLAAGAANTIAFNGGNGVFVNFGTGNSILRNLIHSNTGLGIDLFALGIDPPAGGVTPNDPGDADTGFVNNLQNFPEISAATFSGGMLTVTYVVPSSSTSSTYPLFVEFFKTDATGQEGQTFLGSDIYTAAEAGTVKTVSFPSAVAVAAGDSVVGTATDASGNSSEFTSQSAPIPPDGEPSSADLAVTKSDSPDPVLVGQNVTYTVTVFNNGPDAATNVVLTDTLPSGVTFVSATGGAVPSDGVLTFNLGTISNGGSGSVTIIVSPNQEGSITNRASVSAEEEDPNENNNAAVQDTTVTGEAPMATDLRVRNLVSAATVHARELLTFTVVVRNLGPSPAVNVELSDAVPAGTKFVSLTAPLGWVVQTPPVGGAVTATRSNVAVGEVARFEMVVRVRARTAAGTVITNTAQVASATTDTDPNNNSASVSTEVLQVATQQQQIVTLVGRDAEYRSELGLFLVDDATGRIGTLRPGDVGYVQAALSRRQLFFTRLDPVGTSQTFDLPPGSFYGWYLAQNATSASVLTRNPTNRMGGGPLMFFSFQAANPDAFEHMRTLTPTRFGFEDMTNGGDRDFNDLVVEFGLRDAPVGAAKQTSDHGKS